MDYFRNKNPHIEIIPAQEIDSKLISELGAKTFQDAFSQSNNPEDMEAYISEKFGEKNIKSEILDPNSKFFIAYYDNAPAGYLKLIKSRPPEEIRFLNSIELQRIYVLKEFYNKKLGKEMMSYSVSHAGKNFDSIWLGVWKLNHKAVEFYKKWGFEIFGSRNFKLGSSVKDDWLMIKKLK